MRLLKVFQPMKTSLTCLSPPSPSQNGLEIGKHNLTLEQRLGYLPIWFYLVLSTTVGLFLRLHGLERLSFWFDEACTTWRIHQPFGQIPFHHQVDSVPFLYYYLLKCWSWIWRDTDFSLRLFSALLGTAAIPVVFFLGRSLFDAPTGLMASLLLALSSYHLQYSQEARCYALLTVLFGLTWYFLSNVLRDPKTSHWSGYVLCGILLIYCHGVSILYIVLINLTVLIAGRSWKIGILKRWLVANAAVFSSFLPWLPFYLIQVSSFHTMTELPKPTLGHVISTWILLGSLPPSRTELLPDAISKVPVLIPAIQILWFISCTFLVLVPRTTSVKESTRPLLGLYFLTFFPAILVALFSNAFTSIYVDRLFLVCLVPFVLLLAVKLRDLYKRNSKLATAVFLLYLLCDVFSVHAYYHSEWKENYRDATECLLRRAKPGDSVIFLAGVGEMLFDRYAAGRAIGLVKTGLPDGIYDKAEPDVGLRVKTPQDIKRLADIVQGKERVWFFRNRTWSHDPHEYGQRWLDLHMTRAQEFHFNGIELTLYQEKPSPNLGDY